MTAGFRGSAGRIDVTPPEGFPLGGYALRSGVSQGVLDPISARLLLLDAGQDRLLLISLDWVHVEGRWVQDVKEALQKQAGIDGDHAVITATHTHSGPGVFGSSLLKAPDEAAYLSGVRERIVDVARRLVAETRDVTATIGSTQVIGLGANRNDPEVAVDDELSVLTFKRLDNTAVGRIITYGCHPTVLGPENLLFSGDWVGRGLSAIDRQQGGLSLFINGAAGDVSTRFTRTGRGLAETERYAEILREAVRRAEAGSVALSGGTIEVKNVPVPVSYRDLPDHDEAGRALARAQRDVADSREKGKGHGEIRRLESIREGAMVSLFLASEGGFEKILGKREMSAGVSLVRVGGAGMVFFPGEVMSGTAISLKAAAKCPVGVCGYANDYFGYLNPGDGDYESSMTLLSSESVERIIDAARRLITEDR